jgi:uncharacterized protein (DUF2249 family)
MSFQFPPRFIMSNMDFEMLAGTSFNIILDWHPRPLNYFSNMEVNGEHFIREL